VIFPLMPDFRSPVAFARNRYEFRGRPADCITLAHARDVQRDIALANARSSKGRAAIEAASRTISIFTPDRWRAIAA
jgi:hypothetical protein